MQKTSKKPFSLNPISLLLDSLRDFKAQFVKILLVSAVVAIPGSILRVITFDNGVTDFSIVASIAGLYASLALLYAFAQPAKLKKNSWAKTYVESSGRFLPYLGVTILQGAVALVSILGLLVPVLVISDVVSPVFGLFGVAAGLITLWLLIKLSLASVITATTPLGVLAALRASWLGTKKHFWPLLFAWMCILVAIIVVSGIILSGVYAMPTFANNQLIIALVNGILVSFILPVVIGYAVHIWNRIKQT